ncbi:hypothetical protein ACCO45_009859 [Purpureocillium lilacinum]|uniref:Uncharacterized protein n=1 Tax=Purpureocillium lilacinum TaxID=33203 RepID=A0ACC4DHM7_PURLI
MATFSQFSSLPTELRRLIWLHCLPSRVAAVDIPRIGNDSWNAAFGEGNQEYCLLSTSHRNAAPPIVSQVCRESRDVALEVGHALAYGVFQGLETVWVQPSRDVLHLNWDREWCIADGDAVGTTSAIPNFFALAAERNMIVSVCADLFLPFDIHSVKTCSDRLSDQDLDDAIWFDPDSVDEVLLRNRRDRFRAFGHYGEERIQMIDFNDTMKLHLFTKFWAKCAGGEQNASPETSLWNLCTSNEIQDRVRDWVKGRRFNSSAISGCRLDLSGRHSTRQIDQIHITHGPFYSWVGCQN